MWTRVTGFLRNLGLFVLAAGWLLVAALLTGLVLGPDVGRGVALPVVMLVAVAPLFVGMAATELVHRLKHGPQPPGRHARVEPGAEFDDKTYARVKNWLTGWW